MKFKELYKEITDAGIGFPFIRDAHTKEPSMTMTFALLSFMVAITGIIFLTLKSVAEGSIAAILFWVICMVFYRIRKLDKFKIDLDDKSIELEGSDDEPK